MDTIYPDPAYWKPFVRLKTTKLQRLRTGVGNPNYKRQIKAAVNATTPLSGTFNSLEGNNGYYRIDFIWTPNGDAIQTRLLYGNVARYFARQPEWVGWTNLADAKASAKYLEKVRELQVRFSGPTFLGELRETMRMLRRPAEALRDGVHRYLDDVKRLNRENRNRYFNKNKPRYSQNLRQIAGGLWLEHAFGWLPLLHDINDAKEAFNDLIELPRLEKFSVGGIDSRTLVTDTSSTLFSSPIGIYFLQNEVTTQTTSVRYRGAVKAQAATTAADRLARFGFTPSEFIPTAWELLPWSFLADYFANIGDILNSWVTDTSSVAWVNKSVVNKMMISNHFSIDRSWLKATFTGANKVVGIVDHGSWSKWRLSNVTRTNIAPDSVRVPFRTFAPTSPGRLANIAALLGTVNTEIHPQRPKKRNFRI